MNTPRIVRPVFCFMLLVVLGASVAYTQEKKITVNNLPASVRSAFEKAYPKATIKGVSQEVEDGKTFYEIESIEGTTHRDINYTPDGSVDVIEEVISADSVPKAVALSLKKEYPKAKVEKIEKIVRGNVIQFEYLLTAGKKRYEVVFDDQGKVVKTEAKNAKEKD